MMDLDPEARRVLELAREARTPSEDDRQRVARRLAAGLGLSVVAGTAGAAAQGAGAVKSAGAAVALKWWIAGGAIVAATLGGYAVLSGAPRDDAGREPPRAKTQAPSLQVVQPKTAEPAVAAPVAQAVKAPEPTRESASEPVVHPPQRHRGGVAASLPAELELLHEAQAAWRARDARGALSLLEAHRARFPRSTLRSEREGLQVLSLCELGRKTEAARVAHRLLERAPNSPLRPAIEQSCASR